MERIAKGIWIPIELWQDKTLSWNEKVLLMEIDSFTTKDKDCCFSNEYIATLLGVTNRMARTYLSNLCNKGFVKVTKFDGRCRYVISTLPTFFHAEWKEISTQSGNLLPHNNINNKLSTNVDNKNIINRKRFSFQSALIKLGVSKEVASSWMLVRKNAGATNTEIAFNRIAKEIEKSGRTADECITIAVEKSWRGFEASWLEKRQQTQRQDIPDNKSVNDIWK